VAAGGGAVVMRTVVAGPLIRSALTQHRCTPCKARRNQRPVSMRAFLKPHLPVVGLGAEREFSNQLVDDGADAVVVP